MVEVQSVQPNGTVSSFDGGVWNFITEALWAFFIASFTFGLLYPWALTMMYSWQARHTVIQGKRLAFNGKAMSLFWNMVKWILLSIVTLGIYSFWAMIELEKWRVENTTFA